MSFGETLLKSGEIIPLWFLQGIGAFPYRDQLAPLPVYVLFVLLGLLAVEGAVRQREAPRRSRAAPPHGGVVRVPFVITAITWEKYNHTWQGRYGLAWGLSLAVVVGLGVEHGASGTGGRPWPSEPEPSGSWPRFLAWCRC